MLDQIKKTYSRIYKSINQDFIRYIYEDIDFNARLIILSGARGVGKTTLLIQRLQQDQENRSIYISLDNIIFQEINLSTIIDQLYEEGYRQIALDEVHKYPNWSIEIKNIYDSYPDLKMLVTASSALDIMHGMADLSRRADLYRLSGLSLREYLIFEQDINIPKITVDNIIKNHQTITAQINEQIEIKKYFNQYLKKGYYPFYKEAGRKYPDKLNAVVNQVIDVDLPQIFSMDYNSVRQIKKLLSIISRISPFTPNITKLSSQLGIARHRVLTFIDYLDKAELINVLRTNSKSDSAMTKPDKIFLDNTNLAHSLAMNTPNVGTIRETFFMNALSIKNQIHTPAKGDFMIDERYTVEVGGPNKSFKQITGMPNAYLVLDEITESRDGIIPIWIFGFLY